MYAVIKTGGKQYRVQPGDVLVVEKLDGEVGGQVAFDHVLMLGDTDGGETVVGAPTVEGAVVRGTFIETRKGEKIKVFKKIRRQGYRRTKGHRQFESVLRITGLEGAGRSAAWEGEVDLTPRSVLVARARGLAPKTDTPAVQARPVAIAPAETSDDVAAKRALVEQPISETPVEGSQTEAPTAKAPRTRKPKAAVDASAPETPSADDAPNDAQG